MALLYCNNRVLPGTLVGVDYKLGTILLATTPLVDCCNDYVVLVPLVGQLVISEFIDVLDPSRPLIVIFRIIIIISSSSNYRYRYRKGH